MSDRFKPALLRSRILAFGYDYLFTCILLFSSHVCVAQTQLATQIFGTEPGTTAQVFGPGLVSSNGDEYGVTVNDSWTELFFTRVVGEMSVIMEMHRDGESWTIPQTAPFSGEFNDSHPWLHPKGSQLIYVSRRSVAGSSQTLNVWQSNRSVNGWSESTLIGGRLTDRLVHAPSISNDGTIYATGLIVARKNGDVYESPTRFSPELEGSHPAVSPDGSYIVFSARRDGGFGSKDLYVIFKDNGSWTEPENLGDGVNGSSGESSPTLSADGRFLFFSRMDDAWWVSTSVIEQIRILQSR